MAAFVVTSLIFAYPNSVQFDIALRLFTVSIGTGNFVTSAWVLPLNVVVPIDTQTISGLSPES